MSGFNKFSGEIQGKFIMFLLPKKKVTPFPKKKLVTSEKVTTSEEVEKGPKNLDDIKEAVLTIRVKDLDTYEGRYIVSTS